MIYLYIYTYIDTLSNIHLLKIIWKHVPFPIKSGIEPFH
jgi:hypothetical protein